MDELLAYARSFVGVPYVWGGEHPMDGYDCGGFVQEVLASAGEDKLGDQTAQGIYDHLIETGTPGAMGAGVIAFFGKSVMKITHVAFCVDGYRMLEAGGGGSRTLTREDAIRDHAMVRERLIKNRRDLVATIKPQYNKIGLI